MGDFGVSRKTRRYALKSSEAKAVLNKASAQFGVDMSRFFDAKATVEAAETGEGEVLLINRKPILFKVDENVYPTLLFDEFLKTLPEVVVDMGAIRHVCNGADIMAPGIVRIKGEFKKGALALVVDVKHGKKLALGEMQVDAESAKATKKGVVVKNVHFVGDAIWNAMKELAT
jgi:PUA domain protein